jgi:predicted short-subunit dehydrogenase-like oxidoreductase (DUF2520 family)
MPKSLAIVGAGRVGRALGRRLRELGWRIGVVAARTKASAQKAVRFIGAGQAQAGVTRQIFGSTTILVSVPDDVIASVADELARIGGEELRGKSVIHTSGALDAGVLQSVRACGAAVASMHPMQTFSGVGVPPLEGKLFAIEGDEAAVRTARVIARALGGSPVGIAAAVKPLYHAAGAFAAGHLLALEETGVQMMMKAGMKRREATRALLALSRQVLDHYEKLGPHKAWSGPLSRGDYGVVAGHEEALQRRAPEFLEAYRAVSRLAARVLAHRPAAMLEELEAIAVATQQLAKAKGGQA